MPSGSWVRTLETQLPIAARNGRYGPYVTEVLGDNPPKGAKAKTSSLFKTMSLDTITLEEALRLLQLPRLVGVDPTSGEEIMALERALRAIPEERYRLSLDLFGGAVAHDRPRPGAGHLRRAEAAGRTWQRPDRCESSGQDPGSDLPVVVRDGRFGPYVTDGEYNATLRKGDEPETITLQRAAELLADKRANGPAPKKRAAKKIDGEEVDAKKSAAKRCQDRRQRRLRPRRRTKATA